jgi:hypothetical protein
LSCKKRFQEKKVKIQKRQKKRSRTRYIRTDFPCSVIMDTKSATIAISSAALAAVATYFLLGKQKKVRAADYPEFQTKLAAVLARLAEIKVVPVVAIDDAADAVPLARALVDGGLPCAEITFRTAAAEDAIRAVAQANLPGMLIGAGTVLDVDQAQRAVAAGNVGSLTDWS